MTATPSTLSTRPTALDNCQISFFDLKMLIELKKKKIVCRSFFPPSTSFGLFLRSPGSRRTRELLRPAGCSNDVGRAGWQPRCSGQRSSQAGRRGKEPCWPRFTHLPSGEAMGACWSGTRIRAGREAVAPRRGGRKEESVLPKPGCGAQKEAAAFPSRKRKRRGRRRRKRRRRWPGVGG